VTQDVGKVSLPKVQDAMPVQIVNVGPGSGPDVQREGTGQAQGVLATVDHNRPGPGVLFRRERKPLRVFMDELLVQDL
jgi:hypothetical protein